MTAPVSSLANRSGTVAAAIGLLAVLLLPGCGGGNASPDDGPLHDQDGGGCSADPRASPYAPGMAVPSSNGKFTLQLQKSNPAPPAKGDNTWDIQLRDELGGPVNGALIEVTPFMPDHGHGTSIDAGVMPAPSDTGEYSISPINLWMPGLWQVTLHAEAGDVEDDVVLGFCIAG